MAVSEGRHSPAPAQFTKRASRSARIALQWRHKSCHQEGGASRSSPCTAATWGVGGDGDFRYDAGHTALTVAGASSDRTLGIRS